MEEAVISPALESGVGKLERTVNEIGKLRISPENSEEGLICGNADLTVVTDSCKGFEGSPNNSNQSEVSGSSISPSAEGDSSNVDEMLEKSSVSDATSKSSSVDETCGLEKIENEILYILDSDSISITEAPTQNEKVTNGNVAGSYEDKNENALVSNNLTNPALKESWGDSPEVEESNSSKSTSVNEASAFGKIENEIINILNKTHSNRNSEEKKILEKDIKEKTKESKIIAIKFCAERKIPIPNKNALDRIVENLYLRQQLDEQQLKIALEKTAHSQQNNSESSSAPIEAENSSSSESSQIPKSKQSNNSVQNKGKQIPHKKRAKEITIGGQNVPLKEFEDFMSAVKPIAIKQCHTLKVPFPNDTQFKRTCKNLFINGPLDEETVTVAIEKGFEEKYNDKTPLSDNELNLILKHYCSDNGIGDVSDETKKKEILQKIPRSLLTHKHYWRLMYEERKTNLFKNKSLNHPDVTKLDAKPPNNLPTPQKSSGTSNGKKAGSNPKRTTAFKSPQTLGKSQTQRKSVHTKDGNQQQMDSPRSNNNQRKMTGNKSAQNHSKSTVTGAMQKENARETTAQKRSNESKTGTSNANTRNPSNSSKQQINRARASGNNTISSLNRRTDNDSQLLRDFGNHVRNFIRLNPWQSENHGLPQKSLFQYQSGYDQSQMYFGNKQGQWGKSRNNQQYPPVNGSNYYNNGERPYPGLSPVPIFPPARNHILEYNFPAQNPKPSNADYHRDHSRAPFTSSETIKVAIVHDDYPRRKITAKEAHLIRNALLKRIGGPGGTGPRFCDSYEERGAIVFECENRMTANWVWANAYDITPWMNAKLRPNVWEKSHVAVCIEVPKTLHDLTVPAICQRLVSQNPGLSTEQWKLKSDTYSPHSWQLIFNIDNGSLEVLKSLELRPFLGFSRINVLVNQE